MEEVLKRFTLIDFIGIFVPGAVMTLALNFYGPDLTAPFDSFFGKNAVMLALYFLALSYLVGSALHQLGAFLERFCGATLGHEDYHGRQEIQEAYHRCFYTDIPANPQEAWARILRYLQRSSRPERVILFNGFYTMSRTAAVTLICILPMAMYCHRSAVCSWQAVVQILAYIGVIGLFICRWRRFEKKFVEEVYVLFSLQKLGPDKSAEASQEVRLTIRFEEKDEK